MLTLFPLSHSFPSGAVIWVFPGLEIAPNGIGLLVDHMGRCTGEAYVQFTSSEMLARAKEKHMEKIGHRWLLPGQLTGGLGIRVCFHDDASVFICLTKESDWNCLWIASVLGLSSL